MVDSWNISKLTKPFFQENLLLPKVENFVLSFFLVSYKLKSKIILLLIFQQSKSGKILFLELSAKKAVGQSNCNSLKCNISRKK